MDYFYAHDKRVVQWLHVAIFTIRVGISHNSPYGPPGGGERGMGGLIWIMSGSGGIGCAGKLR